MTFRSPVAHYLFNPLATRLLLRAQRLTILHRIAVHQVALCAMRLRPFADTGKPESIIYFPAFLCPKPQKGGACSTVVSIFTCNDMTRSCWMF
jgi:hypothetical protein